MVLSQCAGFQDSPVATDLFGQAIARGDASAALLQMSAEADAALRYVPHYLNVQQEQTYPVGLLDHVWMDCCLAPIEIYTEGESTRRQTLYFLYTWQG